MEYQAVRSKESGTSSRLNMKYSAITSASRPPRSRTASISSDRATPPAHSKDALCPSMGADMSRHHSAAASHVFRTSIRSRVRMKRKTIP